MMKTAVTGSTGFLGSHIVERLLAQGNEVRALVRRTSDISHLKTTGAEIIIGDVEDYDSLRPLVEGVELVFHAAAKVMPGWGSWQEFESCIVKGTENMLYASAEAKVARFLHVSSGDVYGGGATSETRDTETSPLNAEFHPYSYYGYAKMLADKLAQEYHREGNLQVTIIRCSGIFGPRDRLLTDRFYGLVNAPVVVWPGKSNPRAALTYVTDVVECAILAATSDRSAGQVYNVVPAEEQRFREFAAALARALGKSERQWNMPMSLLYSVAFLMEKWARLWRFKEPPFLTRADLGEFENSMYIDGSKARSELGWEPKVSIDEGTKLYVQWRRLQGKR
jgi:nucleoside-diphosphate-sugar epimerase